MAEEQDGGYQPNRTERRRAAKKQQEARAKITKNQLWKAIEELREALGHEMRENRSLGFHLERERTALAVLLTRLDGETTVTQDEIEALAGRMHRLVYTPVDEGYTVAVIEVVLDDEDDTVDYDDDGEEE